MALTDEEEDLEIVEDEAGDDPPADKPKPADKPDPTVALREENARLRRENEEKDLDNAYWRGRGEKAEKPAPADDDDDVPAKLSDDLVDALSSGDNKRIVKVLGELGFVSKKDVDAKITQTRASIAKEAKVYEDHPDLRNPTSPFFKAAAGHYNDLVKKFGAGNQAELIAVAAKLAKADIGEDIDRDDDPPPRKSKEEERQDRVRSQSGNRGTRRTREADPDELSEEQSGIVAKFQSVGAPVTKEGYVKHAKSGIKMAGVPARRS